MVEAFPAALEMRATFELFSDSYPLSGADAALVSLSRICGNGKSSFAIKSLRDWLGETGYVILTAWRASI